jgi:hypothetical protein
MNVKPDEPDGATAELVSDTRSSGRTRIVIRQFADYELYVTVEEEEELMLATVEENPVDDNEDEEVLAAVAHFIMVHYKEKEGIKKKKKKYKLKSMQYQLEEGIKRFSEQGESAVTKELYQFNKYKVFKPKHTNDLLEEDRKKALSLLIFLKEKKSGAVKSRPCANGSVQRKHVAKEEEAVPTVGLDLYL